MKAAREANAPVTREQAVWALKRTNGHEGASTEMISAQANARKAIAVLRSPSKLAEFTRQLGNVTGSQVRKVRSTLRMEGVKEIIEIITAEESDADDDDDDEAAGETVSEAEVLVEMRKHMGEEQAKRLEALIAEGGKHTIEAFVAIDPNNSQLSLTRHVSAACRERVVPAEGGHANTVTVTVKI